MVFRTAKVFKW